MPETPLKKLPAGPEKPARHGIYSWVSSKKLPHSRSFQAIRRDLSVMREELIRQHGGGKISPDAAILVDSVIEALGVQKILGLYIRQYGVVDGQSAKRGRLELSPILSKNWISYGNLVRCGLVALKEIDRDRPDTSGEDVLAYVARVYPEDKPQGQGAQDAEKRATSPVEPRSPGSAPDSTDNSDDTPRGDNKTGEA